MPAGPTTLVDGSELVAFTGTNYLGLAGDSRVVDAARDALAAFGTSASASPVTTGRLAPHVALERDTAAFLGVEACLSLPAGFLANLAAVEVLDDRVDHWLCDANAHPSIAVALRQSRKPVEHFRHRDADDARRLARARDGRAGLITDGVFAVDGAIAPVADLLDAVGDDGILVVDEAHAIGTIGPEGRGVFEHAGIDPVRTCRTGVYSKALGAHGGYVAGDRALCDAVRDHSHAYRASTALAPALAVAARTALAIVVDEPDRVERLRTNVMRVHAACSRVGIGTGGSPVPIFAIDAPRAEAVDACGRAHGVFLAPFVYPAADRGELVRWTVRADHRPEHIAWLAAALRDALGRV